MGVGELAYEQSPLVSVDVPQASFLLFRVARIHADSPEWGLCWETRHDRKDSRLLGDTSLASSDLTYTACIGPDHVQLSLDKS